MSAWEASAIPHHRGAGGFHAMLTEVLASGYPEVTASRNGGGDRQGSPGKGRKKPTHQPQPKHQPCSTPLGESYKESPWAIGKFCFYYYTNARVPLHKCTKLKLRISSFWCKKKISDSCIISSPYISPKDLVRTPQK